jgi:hypothetical protein
VSVGGYERGTHCGVADESVSGRACCCMTSVDCMETYIMKAKLITIVFFVSLGSMSGFAEAKGCVKC